jgi:hypothetical protein
MISRTEENQYREHWLPLFKETIAWAELRMGLRKTLWQAPSLYAFPMVQSVQERRHCACHPPTFEYLPPALHFLSEFPLSMHRAVQSLTMPYC